MKIEAEQTPDPVIHDTGCVEDPTALRVLNLALPFLVMMPRARLFVSLGMGGYQVYCLGRDMEDGEGLVRLAYISSTLGLQVLRPDVAEIIQTLVELGINAKDLYEDPEKGKASLRVMRSVIDSLALRWGTRAHLLATMLLQVVLDLVESVEEFQRGRILETIANLLLAAIRTYRAVPLAKRVKRDWFGEELSQERLNEILGEIEWSDGRFDFEQALEEGNYKSTVEGLSFVSEDEWGGWCLSDVDFRNIDFRQCDFHGAVMLRDTFESVSFEYCNLGRVVLNESHFRNVRLIDTSLRGTYLHNCRMTNVAFNACDLFESSFFLTRAKDSELRNCDLTDCLLLDAKDQFEIHGGTPHKVTRAVVGISWHFDEEGIFREAADEVLGGENMIVLRVETIAGDVHGGNLGREVVEATAQVKGGLSIADEVLRTAKPKSELATLRDRAALLFQHVDAFFLPGGADIEPELYGAKREEHTYTRRDLRKTMQEMAFLQAAKEQGTQVMGVCRGSQLINVFHGGTMRQHVEGHDGEWHEMENRSPNPLAKRLIGDKIKGLSLHHQAMDEIGQGLEVILEADGVPKLLMNEQFIASQFHPEAYPWMDDDPDSAEKSRNFFRYVAERARKSRETRLV